MIPVQESGELTWEGWPSNSKSTQRVLFASSAATSRCFSRSSSDMAAAGRKSTCSHHTLLQPLPAMSKLSQSVSGDLICFIVGLGQFPRH